MASPSSRFSHATMPERSREQSTSTDKVDSCRVSADSSSHLTDVGAHAREQGVRNLVERYRTTVESLNQEAIQEIWMKTDQVTFIHPRGHERGWDSVWSQFYLGTMGLFSKRTLQVRDVQVFLHDSLAHVEFYWDFRGTFQEGGAPLSTNGRESQTLLLTEAGWQIAHVHYSGMPVTGAREGF